MTGATGRPPASDVDFWDAWHERRLDRPHRDQPSGLAVSMARHFTVPGTLLELGYGEGVDTLYFAKAGHRVTGVDIAPTAVQRVKSRAEYRECEDRISLIEGDLIDLMSFASEQFDCIYSSLALHYFDCEQTEHLFAELHRVCKPGGNLVFSVKSTSDPLYGKGLEIDEDMFYYNGHRRHFFSIEYSSKLLASWIVKELSEVSGYYGSQDQPNWFVHAAATKAVETNGGSG